MFSAKSKARMKDKLIDIVKDAGIIVAPKQKYLRFEICANDYCMSLRGLQSLNYLP
jgi:hypothetical protein